ncbi:hypothetical protein HD806DRAFT_484902 [Xylariaceae sp. AK1471]|nr:hypothetical protein HD806DRAFT_484902 [Xylariaceae sp. AK1471]
MDGSNGLVFFWVCLRSTSWASGQSWRNAYTTARSRFVKPGNQAIRLHEAKRANSYFITSAKMAPVWADPESASCGLNTKQALGCNDDTLCLFRSIVLASEACNATCTHYHSTQAPFN